MRRSLFRNATLCSRYLLHSNPIISETSRAASTRPLFRFYSSDSSGDKPNPVSVSSFLDEVKTKGDTPDVNDVSNKELKEMLEKYFKGDEQVLPMIMEAIVLRKMSGKHEETDDELLEELEMKPLDDVNDKEFESDFEELHTTDEELDDLYDARSHVVNKMVKDEFFYMNDTKWDEMVKEATELGFVKNTKECQEILEDMLHWDKLLPDDIKEKVEKKFNELGDMCERGEMEPEKAYELFKEFEEEIVHEYVKKMEAEGPPKLDETAVPDFKKKSDDPPGKGPILRWQTRVVMAPGGDAWHPKNRKVKMSVTVKELGLSKYQLRRLRELVGKRYHPGRDELTITSERFEHREENRKDCLRTLFALIEDAAKADKLVEDARVSYAKNRLRANPAFMGRLQAKVTRQGTTTVTA